MMLACKLRCLTRSAPSRRGWVQLNVNIGKSLRNCSSSGSSSSVVAAVTSTTTTIPSPSNDSVIPTPSTEEAGVSAVVKPAKKIPQHNHQSKSRDHEAVGSQLHAPLHISNNNNNNSSSSSSNSSNKPSAPPAPGGKSAEEDKRRVQSAIRALVAREHWLGVVAECSAAEASRLVLDSEDYNLVLTACTRVSVNRENKARVAAAAGVAFGFFMTSRAIPLEVFNKMALVCRLTDDPYSAQAVYRAYSRRYSNVRGKERVLYPVLLTVARHINAQRVSDVRRDQFHQYFGSLLEELQAVLGSGAPQPEEELFVETARAFSSLGQTESLLQTLVAMTAAKYSPSIALCHELLHQALWLSDTKVLKVLLGWFLHNFESGVDMGVIDRALHIAAHRGDEAIARLAFKMLALSGHTADVAHYVCWARACLLSHNINGAIEALLEAQGQGVDTLASPYGPSLQALLAETFKSTTQVLDGIYYALVDLRRGNYRVPPVIVNALIIAAGKLSQLDRAFGTFQEYETLFGLRPDIHAHNALLCAIASSKFPQLEMLMTILQDMEAAGLAPDDTSFSLLLITMAESGEMKAYDDIVAYMLKLGRQPTPLALRRVIVRLASDGQTRRLEEALELLRTVSKGSDPPSFLVRRLQSIKERNQQQAMHRQFDGDDDT